MTGRRGFQCAAAALIALALPSAATASAAADAEAIVGVAVEQPPREIRAHWSAARMRAAEPAHLIAPSASGTSLPEPAAAPRYALPSAAGAPATARLRAGSPPTPRASDVSAASAAERRVHGKVFFTLGADDFVCSATVVSSASRALVWTAGHCVHGADIGAGYATNWMFVPGYRDGARPFGTWTATRLLAAEEWVGEANVRYDLGAAVLARDPQGRGIEDLIGARGIAFNQPRNQTFDIFGYPAEDANTVLLPPNFDGERLWLCRSPRTADDSPAGSGPETMEIQCDMTGGSSGGSWVIGDRFVNSVTSYGYQFDNGHLYGPFFGPVAESLYTTASGPPQRCARAQVTNLGTVEANLFSGTTGSDGFKLLAGDDGARGDAGNDAACGGGGADRLAGAEGTDRLRGGGGDDILIGGPGRDVCDGGPGRDRAVGCEKRRRIP